VREEARGEERRKLVPFLLTRRARTGADGRNESLKLKFIVFGVRLCWSTLAVWGSNSSIYQPDFYLLAPCQDRKQLILVWSVLVGLLALQDFNSSLTLVKH